MSTSLALAEFKHVIFLGASAAAAAGGVACGSDVNESPPVGSNDSGSGGLVGAGAGNAGARVSSGSGGAAGGENGTGGAHGGAAARSDAGPGELGGPCGQGECRAGLACWYFVCRRLVAACTPGACAPNEFCERHFVQSKVERVCVPKTPADGDCEFEVGSCVDGYTCDSSHNSFGSPRACRKQTGPMEACSMGAVAPCVAGYHCGYDPVGKQQVCLPVVGLHGACQVYEDCASGLFCQSDTHTCEALHASGDSCRTGKDLCGTSCLENTEYCQEGLVCVPMPGASGCFQDSECASPGSMVCCESGSSAGTCETYRACKAPLGVCALP